MFWSDITEIREGLARLIDRLVRMDDTLERILGASQEKSELCFNAEVIKKCIEEVFEGDDEFGSIHRIHDKLDRLLDDSTREDRVALAMRTLDKFEDYMKNVDKLNAMVNEFKGCISMARGALEERKEVMAFSSKQREETDSKLDKIHQEMAKFARILQKREKKSRKPRKP